MKRSAFTLIEVLAALAITAILMVAVLIVIGTLGRTRRAMERAAAKDDMAVMPADPQASTSGSMIDSGSASQSGTPGSAGEAGASTANAPGTEGSGTRGRGATRRLVELIQQDLRQAQDVYVSPNRIEIVGYGALSGNTLMPTHLPNRTIYRIATQNHVSWLVREQKDLVAPDSTSRAGSGVWAEPVARGVTGVVLDVPAPPPSQQGDKGPAAPPPLQGGIPARVHLAIARGYEQGGNIEETLLLR